MVNPLEQLSLRRSTTRSSNENNNNDDDDDDDCVVWDESRNADLRKMAFPSYQSPKSDADEASPLRQGDESSSSKFAPRETTSASEEKKRERLSEREIDTMWSRLKREDPANHHSDNVTTSASSDTPLRSNHSATPSTAPQENRWGLVKRRRRRTGDRQRSQRPLSLSAATTTRQETTIGTSKRRMPSSAINEDPFADLLEQLKTPDRVETMPPPQKSRKSLSSLPAKTPNAAAPPTANEASPDPFGPFPDMDFDALDRSIDMTQAKDRQSSISNDKSMDSSLATSEQAVTAPTPAPTDGSTPKANTALPKPENTIHTTAAQSKAVDTSIEEDPFGEFPNIDIKMIERKIDQAGRANGNPPQPSASTVDEDDPFGDFPDVDFDALDEQIAAVAQPSPTPDKGLSRYRVLQVKNDVATFTKTLHVSKWRDGMYSEFEERLAGREKEDSSPAKRVWPVDGSIHLRGQWYHTEAEEGDFLHIYSLYGRARTSSLPLTLDTRPDAHDDDLVLIMHPELLLVPTTISETTKCTRRAVLKNRLGSSGSSQALLLGTLRHRFFEETLQNLDMSQNAIRERIDSIVREASEDIVGCLGTTSAAVKTELFKFVPQVKRFLDDYTSLLPKHQKNLVPLLGNTGEVPIFLRAKNVYAIEETIVSPEMGIKGNIDTVLQATVANDLIENPTEALLGVELKTSHFQRTDHSHMAQLVLYNLMLQARYGSAQHKEISNPCNMASRASMLLYLNAESVKAVNVSPSISDVKSLLGARNMVAAQQNKSTQLRRIDSNAGEKPESQRAKLVKPGPPSLPPIENPSMCEKCYMARECSTYASLEEKYAEKAAHSRAHPDLLRQYTSHLSSTEMDYFATWDRLIDCEASAMVRPVAMKWLKPSAEQETLTKRTVSSLVIKKLQTTPQRTKNRIYELVCFERSEDAKERTPISSLGLGTDCHAIISVDDVTTGSRKRSRRPLMHLARGIVHQSSDREIILRVAELDVQRIRRTLKESESDNTLTFRLDRDEVATGLGTLRRNVINLLTGDKIHDGAEKSLISKRLHRLRQSILELREPVFKGSVSPGMFSPSNSIQHVPGADIADLSFEFFDMNQDQKSAVEKVMLAQDYSIIQGLPGTGKTSTISFLIRLLVAHGKRVLITSYTHSAVDNVLLKLIQTGIDEPQHDGTRFVIRLGDSYRCHGGVKHLLANSVASEIDSKGADLPATAESIRRCMRKARVVAVTALSIPSSSYLAGECFDVVIVDEAGQISQPAILGALMAADSFILVGDHMQLPPLVNSELAEKGGFGVSMLKRLADAHPKHVAQLTYQYRMANDICQITNDIVYGGKLKCGNEFVKHRKLNLQGYPEKAFPGIYASVIDPIKSVVFLDTDQRKIDSDEIVELESKAGRQEGGSLVNRTEVTMVERILDSLTSCGVPPNSIGIICPFNAQLRLLEQHPQVSSCLQEGLECSTIDRYQGRDKPVVILSFVRSNTKGKVGRLLGDPRRLNVAVSRAECKLIMVGSFSTLHAGSDALRPALDRLVSTDKVVRVSE